MNHKRQLRVSGIQGLAETFAKFSKSTKASAESALLADAGDRLLASDIVWDDLPSPPEEEVPKIDTQMDLFGKPSDDLEGDETDEDLDEEAEDDDEESDDE